MLTSEQTVEVRLAYIELVYASPLYYVFLPLGFALMYAFGLPFVGLWISRTVAYVEDLKNDLEFQTESRRIERKQKIEKQKDAGRDVSSSSILQKHVLNARDQRAVRLVKNITESPTQTGVSEGLKELRELMKLSDEAIGQPL